MSSRSAASRKAWRSRKRRMEALLATMPADADPVRADIIARNWPAIEDRAQRAPMPVPGSVRIGSYREILDRIADRVAHGRGGK